MSSRKPQKTKDESGRVRLVGGLWRSRILQFPIVDGLRPTGNRTRETLFNWLQYEIEGAVVLDLFAGTGALGFEAASRGASAVTLVEKSSSVSHALRRNASALLEKTTEIHNRCSIEVIERDSLLWLEQECSARFDLVFVDPPFDLELHQRVVSSLAEGARLSENSVVYLELPARSVSVNLPANWQIIRQKTFGQVEAMICRVG